MPTKFRMPAAFAAVAVSVMDPKLVNALLFPTAAIRMAAVGNNNALTNFGSITETATAANAAGILNFVGMVAGNFGNGLTTSTNSQIYNAGTISSQVFGSV